METTDNQRKQMKEDIIKLFVSIHSSSSRSSPPNSSSKLITTAKSSPQTEKLKRLIEDHLPSMFTANLIIPTHPPYALMIREAIKNLKESGEYTNKKSISSYINTNFEGLPWAASQFLNYHLQKLVVSGDIKFISTNSTYHLTEKQEEENHNPNPNPNPSTNPNPSPTRDKKDDTSSQQQIQIWKGRGSFKEGNTDMVLVSPSIDDVDGLDENNQETTVIDVEPLQKQMPETNHIEESVVEKHHGTVEHPIAEKTLLVYNRRRKRSRPLMTSSTEIQKHQEKMSESVAGANDNDRHGDDNDRLMMIVHTPKDNDGNADHGMMMIVPTPKRGRVSNKEKWMKFQQSLPKREFRPRQSN